MIKVKGKKCDKVLKCKEANLHMYIQKKKRESLKLETENMK